jgi:hypothetical protein
MNCCIMLNPKLCSCLMHMQEVFKFEFVAWLNLNLWHGWIWIQKRKKEKENKIQNKVKTQRSPQPPSLGLSVQSAQLPVSRTRPSLSPPGGLALSALSSVAHARPLHMPPGPRFVSAFPRTSACLLALCLTGPTRQRLRPRSRNHLPRPAHMHVEAPAPTSGPAWNRRHDPLWSLCAHPLPHASLPSSQRTRPSCLRPCPSSPEFPHRHCRLELHPDRAPPEVNSPTELTFLSPSSSLLHWAVIGGDWRWHCAVVSAFSSQASLPHIPLSPASPPFPLIGSTTCGPRSSVWPRTCPRSLTSGPGPSRVPLSARHAHDCPPEPLVVGPAHQRRAMPLGPSYQLSAPTRPPVLISVVDPRSNGRGRSIALHSRFC